MATVHDGNGGVRTKLEIPRRDWYKIIGVFFGSFGFISAICVPLLLAFFETKSDAAETKLQAVKTHNDLEKKDMEIEHALDLEVQQAELQYNSTISSLADVKSIAITQDKNIRSLMDRASVPRWKREPMPAGMSIGDIGNP